MRDLHLMLYLLALLAVCKCFILRKPYWFTTRKYRWPSKSWDWHSFLIKREKYCSNCKGRMPYQEIRCMVGRWRMDGSITLVANHCSLSIRRVFRARQGDHMGNGVFKPRSLVEGGKVLLASFINLLIWRNQGNAQRFRNHNTKMSLIVYNLNCTSSQFHFPFHFHLCATIRTCLRLMA